MMSFICSFLEEVNDDVFYLFTHVMMLLSCSLWCHDISFSHQEKGLYVDLRFSLTCML